jgi:hypothetical protein
MNLIQLHRRPLDRRRPVTIRRLDGKQEIGGFNVDGRRSRRPELADNNQSYQEGNANWSCNSFHKPDVFEMSVRLQMSLPLARIFSRENKSGFDVARLERQRVPPVPLQSKTANDPNHTNIPAQPMPFPA